MPNSPTPGSRASRHLPLALLCGALLACGTPDALAANPEAGTWKQDISNTLDGHDVFPMLKKMQDQAMASMTPEDRAKAQAELGRNDPAHASICLTPQAAASKDPQILIKAMGSNESDCQYPKLRQRKGRYEFSGQCASDDGGQAQVKGWLRVIDAHTAESDTVYKGIASSSSATMLGLTPGRPFTSEIKVHMQWSSASCPAPAGAAAAAPAEGSTAADPGH